MSLFFQLVLNGFVNATLLGMMAIGFGIVYRTLKIFHIAYGSIFILAGYALYFFSVLLKLPVVFSLMFAILFSVIVGVLIEKLVYYPLNKKKAGLGSIMIASLGLYVVIENAIAMIFDNDVKVVTQEIGISNTFKGLILTRIQIIELLIGVVVIILSLAVFKKSNIFKAIWAMGDEPELISILGLPIDLLRIIIFAISSLLIAIPAVLISLDLGIDPFMGMSYLLISVVAVILGGVDSVLGWLIGAFILSELQSLVAWKFSSKWNDLVTFSILVVVLLVRPFGILSRKKRIEEIK